ncbi:hypothetical protein LCGC14_2213420 [marine sediment metagenome]|uniref:Uncharacterized protein n=1 Tax=marine sediment metagenome TaxID=412755 RepID=A0A0F9E0K9_9ZZZZ
MNTFYYVIAFQDDDPPHDITCYLSKTDKRVTCIEDPDIETFDTPSRAKAVLSFQFGRRQVVKVHREFLDVTVG